MKFETFIEFIDHAIALIKERTARHPAFPVYAAVLNQLLYIKSVFEGVEKDKSRLHKLSIGALAAKEFEGTDDELARALMDVYYIANQSANGLKIQLPEGLWRP
ncbi:immunity protein Tsi6 family protein [Pseudomonas syringae pv. theae]|uniref:immunity protein Tsi6 family protein n=1 Tax=Pseudomonas syringae TaxID=317 RepID=UPI001F32C945|nr:immunity protein Tsi6 family protein [Pseudomonas syringae]MBL3831407.1 hypothetical protein [Pseudomonas syringae pv. theae]MBL3834202.1 hypothetical protein [Pseudomonas syringae pv. theae]MBL3869620.1 hypothetical protein [Pseudomonas syringae pv. theae]GKQ49074.1 immunity protein Tsi6 family protein [Pseudomonas syringae pv. theae]GKS08870.1 immunity protein Tsi6 family protein [Pseudomonas syringae pv. theae]